MAAILKNASCFQSYRLAGLILSTLLFGTSCSAQNPAEIRLTVGLGGDGCRHVQVPGRAWSVDPTTAGKDSADRSFQTDDLSALEFRSPSAPPSQLYFAAKTSGGLDEVFGPYSKEKYAVEFHTAAPIQSVKREDWGGARPLLRSDTRIAGDAEIGSEDNHDLSYAAKRLVQSGEHLALATGSTNERWIAVFSYDGQQRFVPPQERSGIIGIPGRTKHPTSGRAYIDVYGGATGQKVLALAGPFRGDIPTSWFLTAFFLEDRYFFFGTSQPGGPVRSFWVCEITPRTGK
jgi:hypothetical protein